MSDKISNEQKISYLEILTEKLLSLPESFSLPNGWKLRELYIHLWSWDDAVTKACEAKMADKLADFTFDHTKLGLTFSEWNDKIIADNSGLTLSDAKEIFTTTRKAIIDIYKKLITLPETIEDEKSFIHTDNLLSLFNHDKHHLEQACLEIDL
ncbi:MAG: hypothetical protein ACTSQB_06845 [Candidatus Heimdallarchaeota archaeon]